MKLTLDRPATYQIKVPGILEKQRYDWLAALAISIGGDEDHPITTLTGELDQAALLGLLRRLYSLGLPLILVKCLEF